MTKPLVAVVGRPNVGKSTFFNRIVGQRISIVEDTPGVTRDRIYADAEWCGTQFTLVDTGGLEIKSEDEMWTHIRAQAQIAVDTADLVIFMLDGKTGLTHDDYEVAAFLRKSKKPVILAVNKLDNNEQHLLYDFYELGLGEPYGISAGQAKGLGDLLDAVAEIIGKNESEDEDTALKIAVVGKPNAGKSSLVNKILGYNRVIVSDIAGTTRDAIDTRITLDGKDYVLIDTAGIRRKRSVEENLEQYSVMRSLAAVRRADVCLIVIDSSEELSEQDVKIAGYVHEQGKPSVVVMNKWDTIEKDTHTIEKYNKKLKEELKFMDYFMPVYVSAKTGKRVENTVALAEKAYENASRRISTGLLNDVLQEAILTNEPPSKNGKRLKLYYITEVSANPPTFVVFVNDEKLMHFSYKRYLENALRRSFDFQGTPVRILVRNKNEKDFNA
ncbi:MAG: ribosome biogenesis GTPase Der [Eubacteriales bacterium]|nr:ribosome biogenesis GTPase Der [Christensenellaceae bacterium]MDY2751210.1 ribosome biogenesis GTPase Der [Eubacteriales bacterium]MCI7583748.1 ribosome biogenesis GTPase Der [Christensenellaceae bacterium]MCI7768883.1 ribosome biogenesis GTPase Der [Christensenellaceae bacterium]MDD6361376.1 ribosome biogenesis GTPase Der [Christensenellaceae bacterium]